jgi:hypothetical protein
VQGQRPSTPSRVLRGDTGHKQTARPEGRCRLIPLEKRAGSARCRALGVRKTCWTTSSRPASLCVRTPQSHPAPVPERPWQQGRERAGDGQLECTKRWSLSHAARQSLPTPAGVPGATVTPKAARSSTKGSTLPGDCCVLAGGGEGISTRDQRPNPPPSRLLSSHALSDQSNGPGDVLVGHWHAGDWAAHRRRRPPLGRTQPLAIDWPTLAERKHAGRRPIGASH